MNIDSLSSLTSSSEEFTFFKDGHPHMMETMAFFVEVPASGLLHFLMFHIVSVFRKSFLKSPLRLSNVLVSAFGAGDTVYNV